MLGALTILGLTALSAASAAVSAPPSPADLDFFEKSVRPVLVANCYGCHSNTSGKIRGGLRLDTLNAMRR